MKTFDIANFKKDQSDRNKEKIFKIIKSLGNCSPNEIKSELDKKAKEIALDKYEKGNISRKEKEQIFKDNTIRRETLQRKLREMLDDGSIVKEYDKYSLSELAWSDLRYFNPDSGRDFGDGLLDGLLRIHYPTLDDFKTNIQKFVEILGFYLLNVLIEACRPIKYQHDDKYTENITKDLLTEKWFKQAINHETILNDFVSTVTNQLNDEQRREFFRTHFKKTEKNHGDIDYIEYDMSDVKITEQPLLKRVLDPISAFDFSVRRFHERISEDAHIKYRTTSNPVYEIDKQIIDDIKDILKEKYPRYYEIAKSMRVDCFGRPKERSLLDRRSKFVSIDPITEETVESD